MPHRGRSLRMVAAASVGGIALGGLWSWVRCEGAYGNVRSVASCEAVASDATALSDVLAGRSYAFQTWTALSASSPLPPSAPPRPWKLRADCFTLPLDDPVVRRVLTGCRNDPRAVDAVQEEDAAVALLCALALAGSVTFRWELCLAALWFGGPLAAYEAFRFTTIPHCVESFRRFRESREGAAGATERATTVSREAPLLPLGSWHATVIVPPQREQRDEISRLTAPPSCEGALVFTPLVKSGAGFEGMAVSVAPEDHAGQQCKPSHVLQLVHFLAPFDQFDGLEGSSSTVRNVALAVHTVFCKLIVAQTKYRLRQICVAVEASM